MPHEAGKPESGWRAPEARRRPNRFRGARHAALHWMRDRICRPRTGEGAAGTPARGPAPTLGQHNHELLCDLIGLSEAEYRSLEADGIIGTVYTEDAT